VAPFELGNVSPDAPPPRPPAYDSCLSVACELMFSINRPCARCTPLVWDCGSGGSAGNGTIFSISLPAPQLALARSGANVVLTWPTDDAGFDFTGYTLQSATNLGLSAIWTTNSLASVIADGQNVVTHPNSSPQQFYRLGR
jgi:hypothetical protein